MKHFLLTAIILLALLAMTGCNLFAAVAEPTLDADQIQTLAAGTVQARQTISSLETKVAYLTAQPTTEPVVITATPPKSPTSTPIPTGTTVVLPSVIPSATMIPATATMVIPCNYAAYVSDVSVPDGTTFAPGVAFGKTWRLRNRGTCTWTTGYSLVFSSGDSMSGPASVNLPNDVKPGETVDITVNLVAPSDAKSYTGYYKMRDALGSTFGLGLDGSGRLWVKITVGATTLTDLHLAHVACSAVWKSTSGSIACSSGAYDFSKGTVTVVANPKLAGGYVDDQPAIVMVPSDGTGGEISGRFPPLAIKSGDHFSSLIGFMDGYTSGNVMFMLNYSVDGGADQNFNTWSKTYDTNFIHVDIDLSSLAGHNVQFVLKVINNNSSSKDDVVFWLDPTVVRP